jgi:hypothetical protein
LSLNLQNNRELESILSSYIVDHGEISFEKVCEQTGSSRASLEADPSCVDRKDPPSYYFSASYYKGMPPAPPVREVTEPGAQGLADLIGDIKKAGMFAKSLIAEKKYPAPPPEQAPAVEDLHAPPGLLSKILTPVTV